MARSRLGLAPGLAKFQAARAGLVLAIQNLQTTAHGCGMIITAHALNRAMNAAGWEQAGDVDEAAQAAKGEREFPHGDYARTKAKAKPRRKPAGRVVQVVTPIEQLEAESRERFDSIASRLVAHRPLTKRQRLLFPRGKSFPVWLCVERCLDAHMKDRFEYRLDGNTITRTQAAKVLDRPTAHPKTRAQ